MKRTDIGKVVSMYKINGFLFSHELHFLNACLSVALSEKRELLGICEDDFLVDSLLSDIDTLESLLHVFEDSSEWVSAADLEVTSDEC